MLNQWFVRFGQVLEQLDPRMQQMHASWGDLLAPKLLQLVGLLTQLGAWITTLWLEENLIACRERTLQRLPPSHGDVS